MTTPADPTTFTTVPFAAAAAAAEQAAYVPPPFDAHREAFRRSGYPRPVTSVRRYDGDGEEIEPKTYPVPWVNGEHGADADFYSFRRDVRRAFDERLCCICGDSLGPVVAVAAYVGNRRTSGGWGHPRCTKIAVRMCLHFADIEGTVAWLHTGPGVGVADPTFEGDEDVVDTALPLDRAALDAVASNDPWGQAQQHEPEQHEVK